MGYKEAIELFLTNPVDRVQLQELREASSLLEAPNIDTRPKVEELEKLFQDIKDMKERNRIILDATAQGYSQHMIAKVLGISQPAVFGVIKRSRE
ncbi:MAG: helix-turn-helix domain-containing protein [Campylobacterota bacterium]|nr:helix-turn-helix domain-containing protein [Campylobacterota bacterium]